MLTVLFSRNKAHKARHIDGFLLTRAYLPTLPLHPSISQRVSEFTLHRTASPIPCSTPGYIRPRVSIHDSLHIEDPASLEIGLDTPFHFYLSHLSHCSGCHIERPTTTLSSAENERTHSFQDIQREVDAPLSFIDVGSVRDSGSLLAPLWTNLNPKPPPRILVPSIPKVPPVLLNPLPSGDRNGSPPSISSTTKQHQQRQDTCYSDLTLAIHSHSHTFTSIPSLVFIAGTELPRIDIRPFLIL